jgi:ComF family protein
MTELRTIVGRRPTPVRLLDRALDLVFPPRCVSCDSFGAFLCKGCVATVTNADPPRCPTCWMPGSDPAGESVPGIECGRCRAIRPSFKAVRSVFVYQAAARDAVHALKFRGVSAVASIMAGFMAQRLVEWSPPIDSIVPVPLAGSRRRQRGYNQSELLAKVLSRLTAIPLARRALVRPRSASPQYRLNDRDERRRNVTGAFLPGKRGPRGGVLLVDDVITTGATLNACACVLIEAGAGPVFALTFARED